MKRACAALIAVAACGTAAHNPDADPWQAGVALPGPRLEPGVAALGARLAIVDGFDAQLAIVKTVSIYDPDTDTWSALPDAPVAWTHVDLAAADGSLYLLGGLATTSFTADGTAWVLDSTATSWRQLTSMPAGLERGAAGVVAVPPRIYVIGGAVANNAVASVLAYDISQDSWIQLPDLPSPRSHAAAAVLPDGTLLLVGGLRTLDASQPLNEVLALPIGATAWQTRTPMPTARGGCAYAMFGSRFICAGGEAGASALDVVEAYDWAHDTWSTLPSMPSRRAGTQGARIGARLFVPGGAHQLTFEPDGTMDVLTVE